MIHCSSLKIFRTQKITYPWSSTRSGVISDKHLSSIVDGVRLLAEGGSSGEQKSLEPVFPTFSGSGVAFSDARRRSDLRGFDSGTSKSSNLRVFFGRTSTDELESSGDFGV